MKKTILIFLIATVTSIATAQSVNIEAPPGETTVIDTNITENSSPEIVSSQLPSDINLSINESNLTATPSYSLYPQNYTGKITLSNKYNRTYTVEVPEKFNWTLTSSTLNGSISVGSSGQINTTTIDLESNVDPDFEGEITGNISDYFSVDRFQFEEQGKYTVILGYGVNENTQFGNYSGELTVYGNQNRNQSVNLSYVFEDNILPEITDTEINNVMSTKEASFSAVASDNQKVAAVCGKVWKEAEVERDNSTVLENQTLEDSPYCFKQESNTDLWQLDFADTEEKDTQHYLNLSVNDTSGNAVSRLHSFKVQGLDALEVLETDFRYEAIWPSSQAEREVIELSTSTPVELTLESFRYEGNNTVEPGILKEGNENPQYFSDNDGEITVEDAASYRLVVDSDEDSKIETQKEFSGVLNVTTVPQHVEHPEEIRFSGLVNPGDSPEPASASIGKFDGYAGYSIPERFIEKYTGKATGDIVYIGTVDREECVGFSRWNECTGFTFGKLNDTKQENIDLENSNDSLRFQRNFTVVFALIFMLGFLAYQKAPENVMMQTH